MQVAALTGRFLRGWQQTWLNWWLHGLFRNGHLSVEVIRLRHHLMCIHHVCRRSLEIHSCLFCDSEIRRADRDIAQRSSLV